MGEITIVHITKTAENYNERAANFGEFVKTYRDPDMTLCMLESLGIKSGLTAIDLACGQGDSSRHLKAIGTEVFYIDTNIRMLERGIERGNIPRDHAIQYEIGHDRLPFHDNFCDVAVIRYGLHDIENKGGLLAETYRVLKPNGKLQIVDMYANTEEQVKFYNELHSWKTHGDPIKCFILSLQGYKSLLKSKGFIILNQEKRSSIVKSTQWIAENQITPERHDYIMNLVRTRLKENRNIRKVFGIALRKTYFIAVFPVVILVGKSKKGVAENEQTE